MKKLFSLLAMVLMVVGLPLSALANEHGEPPVEEFEQKLDELIYNQETEEGSWQLANYDSYDALVEDFEQIMSPEVAEGYLESFFTEEDGNAYLVPTEGPPLIQFDQEYDLEQVSDTEYHLTQSSSNALYGDYTIMVTYSYEGDQWMITERTTEYGTSGNGGEMPDTATATPSMILFGAVLIGAGTVMVVRKRLMETE